MGRTTRRLLWLLVLLGPVCLLFRGGAQDIQGPAAQVSHETQPRAGGRWYVVQEGENLRLIAQHVYGSAYHYRLIQLSNDVGLYPDHGERLWLPASADAMFAEEDFEATLVTEVADFETSHTP